MGKVYLIHDIYYGLYGEGALAGTAAVIVSFFGCNLSCHFCQSAQVEPSSFGTSELLAEMKRASRDCKFVVLTGGEPCMQVDEILVSCLRADGWQIALETNGTYQIPFGIDYVILSPKYAPLHPEALKRPVYEIRVPIEGGDALPVLHHLPAATHHFLSPVLVGPAGDCWAREETQTNLQTAINLCESDPLWRLSIQQQKLLRVLDS